MRVPPRLGGSGRGLVSALVERKPLHKISLTCQSCDLTVDESANTKLGEKQCKTAFNPSAEELVYSSAQANAKVNDVALLTESRNDFLLAKYNDNTLYVPTNVPATPLVCE